MKVEWSTPHYGVQHTMRNNRQFTVSQHDNSFAELMIYDWIKGQVILHATFFVKEFEGDSISRKTFFWNCKTIERAIEFAKHYAMHRCYELELYNRDVQRASGCIHEIEHNETTRRHI